MSIDDYDSILTTADAFADGDWREFSKEIQFSVPGEFYYFERDATTGLSAPEPAPRTKGRAPFRYRLGRRVHNLVFEPRAPLFRFGRRFYSTIDEGPRPLLTSLHFAEQAVKVPLFGCKDCGDCSLPDIAYLCPESQCVKNQRNGPCGGTRDGKCEVGDKDCIWALAYDRLKVYGEEAEMLDGPAVIKDNSLRGTSAWANAFLGRDHNAKEAHS
jgi:methylenetetrahydrofolate reductase (NADPH)